MCVWVWVCTGRMWSEGVHVVLLPRCRLCCMKVCNTKEKRQKTKKTYIEKHKKKNKNRNKKAKQVSFKNTRQLHATQHEGIDVEVLFNWIHERRKVHNDTKTKTTNN